MAETEQTEQTEQTQAAETTAAEQEQSAQASKAEYAEVDADASPGGEEHLDLLLDIQLPLVVTLGKTEIPLRRLMQVQPGSVLSLNKCIGQPAELLIQDLPFATGDIVVVDDCYAVRIREILRSPAGVDLVKESKK